MDYQGTICKMFREKIEHAIVAHPVTKEAVLKAYAW